MHHRTFGTIGVYLADAPDRTALAGLRRGQWLCVSGAVQPILAAALPDDPRSVVVATTTPLLLAITGLAVLDHAPERWPGLPQLAVPQRVRVGPPRHRTGGAVADVISQPDFLHWSAYGGTREQFRDWNTVYGLVTTIGAQRYLRYVLSYRLPGEGAPHG